MTLFYGYRRLTLPEHWRDLAGSDKWVPTRSAYELAFAWQGAGGLPPKIAAVIAQSGETVFDGLTLDLCLVEKPVFLDSKKAPSMTDVMAYGRNRRGEPIVVAVEGKADEPFAQRTCAWLRGDTETYESGAKPRPTRVRRLAYLASQLGILVDSESEIRYQLLHRTVSAILEAQLHGAAASLVLIHAFGALCTENWDDFGTFLQEFKLGVRGQDELIGPVVLAGVPVYFLWHQSNTHSSPSSAGHTTLSR